MLVKCKICKTDYNFHGTELPSSGIELKCSECGYTWIELPNQTAILENSSEEILEDQIVEPSILSGKPHEAVKSDTLNDFSISDLAKQELLAQKGVNQKPTINANTEKLNDGSRNRKFEWLVPETAETIGKSARKIKSFEILTKPSDAHNEFTKRENLENLIHDSSNSPNSIPGNGEESINPKLVQRIKGVEKIQNNENDQIEEPLTEHAKGSKIPIIVIITILIFLALYMVTIFQNVIIVFLPFLEPVISFASEIIGLLPIYLEDFL